MIFNALGYSAWLELSLREVTGFLRVLCYACQCHADILISQGMAVEIRV